jgi:hypothetical protein
MPTERRRRGLLLSHFNAAMILDAITEALVEGVPEAEDVGRGCGHVDGGFDVVQALESMRVQLQHARVTASPERLETNQTRAPTPLSKRSLDSLDVMRVLLQRV